METVDFLGRNLISELLLIDDDKKLWPRNLTKSLRIELVKYCPPFVFEKQLLHPQVFLIGAGKFLIINIQTMENARQTIFKQSDFLFLIKGREWQKSPLSFCFTFQKIVFYFFALKWRKDKLKEGSSLLMKEIFMKWRCKIVDSLAAGHSAVETGPRLWDLTVSLHLPASSQPDHY